MILPRFQLFEKSYFLLSSLKSDKHQDIYRTVSLRERFQFYLLNLKSTEIKDLALFKRMY